MKRKIFILGIILLIILLLSSCNNEKSIVGKWKAGIQSVEFTEKGEFKILGLATSNYKVKNDKLIITTLGIEMEYTFSVFNDTLTMIDKDGQKTIYVKEQ